MFEEAGFRLSGFISLSQSNNLHKGLFTENHHAGYFFYSPFRPDATRNRKHTKLQCSPASYTLYGRFMNLPQLFILL